jgi:putative DNA primase/helicase
MLVLKMTKSFYNKEDTELSYKLTKELSGIFNWAMEGLERRITRGGHFIQPEAGKDYLELMAELGNPIGTFVDEVLVFDAEASTPKDDVFACFKHWASKKNLPYGTELAFKRRFLAATQENAIEIGLDRTNGNRVHIYRGVKLNDKAQKFVNENVMPDEGVF